MKVSFLSNRYYNNVDVLKKILIECKDQDKIFLDINPTGIYEYIIRDLCKYYKIETEYVPRATACADAVIIIYDDNTYEWHIYNHDYYDNPFDVSVVKSYDNVNV
jgi:hypothetical protein